MQQMLFPLVPTGRVQYGYEEKILNSCAWNQQTVTVLALVTIHNILHDTACTDIHSIIFQTISIFTKPYYLRQYIKIRHKYGIKLYMVTETNGMIPNKVI
jgi:hypothetical protein